jgi:hypothetical protein
VSRFGDERFRAFHDLSMQQVYTRGDRLPGRVYAENKPFWPADPVSVEPAENVRRARWREQALAAAAPDRRAPLRVGDDRCRDDRCVVDEPRDLVGALLIEGQLHEAACLARQTSVTVSPC